MVHRDTTGIRNAQNTASFNVNKRRYMSILETRLEFEGAGPNITAYYLRATKRIYGSANWLSNETEDGRNATKFFRWEKYIN